MIGPDLFAVSGLFLDHGFPSCIMEARTGARRVSLDDGVAGFSYAPFHCCTTCYLHFHLDGLQDQTVQPDLPRLLGSSIVAVPLAHTTGIYIYI